MVRGTRIRAVRRGAPALALVLTLLAFSAGAQERILRPYDKGPLAPREFTGPVPDAARDGRLQRQAYTRTDLRYDYRYNYTIAGDVFEVELSEIRVAASFVPQESWLALPNDVRLLDHEQGHFDLAEIQARRMRADFLQRQHAGELKFKAASEAAGHALLKQRLDTLFTKGLDTLRTLEEDYDRTTRSGVDFRGQLNARRQLQEWLRETTQK